MTFTALEAMLLAAFVSAIVGVFVRMSSVSPKQCAEYRNGVKGLIAKLDKSNDIQFRMLRALVAHSDLSPELKAELLNMTHSD